MGRYWVDTRYRADFTETRIAMGKTMEPPKWYQLNGAKEKTVWIGPVWPKLPASATDHNKQDGELCSMLFMGIMFLRDSHTAQIGHSSLCNTTLKQSMKKKAKVLCFANSIKRKANI